MLRDNRTIISKPVYADYKAAAAVNTGMGVVLKNTDKTFAVPTGEASAEIYLVDKERIPTGLNAAVTDHSDYDPDFVTVAKGEYAKLKKFLPGEEFLTDQYDEGLTAGKYASVDTTGKFKAATAQFETRYICAGIVNDNGHKLAKIQVLDTLGKNAE